MTTITLYHETFGRPGQQTPLLLVHGGAGTIETDWGYAIPTFAADRLVIGVDSTELIWGLGSFHCISQQEPL